MDDTLQLLKWFRFILKQRTTGKITMTDDEFVKMVDEKMWGYLSPKLGIGVLGIV